MIVPLRAMLITWHRDELDRHFQGVAAATA